MDRPPTVTQAKAIRRYVGVSKGPDFAKQTLYQDSVIKTDRPNPEGRST
jgi:hypothetical protein